VAVSRLAGFSDVGALDEKRVVACVRCVVGSEFSEMSFRMDFSSTPSVRPIWELETPD
jgi:hypothetical protein